LKKSVAYKEITNFIKMEINNGTLLPNQKIYSEAALVEMFNVSRTTAAKSLDILSTENIIYRIQGKGSFVANPHKTNEYKERSNIISLILPFDTNDSNRMDEFNVIRGVESFLKEHNYSLIINYGSDDPRVEMDLIKRSQSKNVDGIIVYPTTIHNNLTFINELYLDGYPIVFIDRKNINIPIECISSDNVQGGYLSTKHLISREYESIYFISDITISSISSINDRYFGYCKALKEFGYKLSEFNLIEGFAMKDNKYCPIGYDNDPNYYKELLKDIYKTDKKKIGFVCVNDLIAYSFVLASLELGFKASEDIGIVGFNDADIASKSILPITTIKQNFYKVGKMAAEIVLSKINKAPHIKNEPIPVELIIRSST